MLTRVLPTPTATTGRRNPAAGLSICAALFAMLAAPQAMGQLVHRYSFTTNANDSVGTAHGTVIDPLAVTHAFVGGELDLSANAGNTSNAITEDAYVNLPNGIVSAAATGGMNGAVAFEYWFTVSENRTWQRLGDFGTSNNGEDTSAAGSASPYLSIVATSGRGNLVDMTNHPSTGQEPAAGFGGTPVLGQQYHIMAVYNHNDGRAFHADGANGTMSLYLNDGINPQQQVAYGAIHPNMNIRTLTDVNNWLGRSQWGDPLFDGKLNEFRIYNTAPSAAYVASSFAAGPNALAAFQAWTPEYNLSFEVDRATGTFTLKNTGPWINVSGITISSASGALDPNKWKSVAGNYDVFGNGSFDSEGAWSISSNTVNQLAETESSNGGRLGTGGTVTSLQLGLADAWTLSRFEDLVVSVTRVLADNVTTETLGVPVSYINGIGQTAARSDLNFDGAITPADWVAFASNHLDEFTGMTLAQAATMGDLDGNLSNNYEDFLLFQADYDAANGVGALTVLMSSVPEPSSVALVLIAGGAALGMRRRQRSQTAGRVGRILAPAVVLFLAGLQASFAQVAVYDNNYQAEVIGGGFPAWNWGGGQITTHNAVYADYAGNTVVEHTGIVLGAGADTRFGSKWDIMLNGNTSTDPAQYTISFDLRNVSGNWNPLPLEVFVLTQAQSDADDAGFGSGAIQIPQGNDWFHVEYNLSELTAGWWQGQDWVLTRPRWSLEVGMPWPGLAPTEAFNQVWLMDNLKIELQPPPAVGLTLEVNTTTEVVKIRNTTANPISFDYYTIDSPQSALDTAGWNSLKDQGIDAGPAADFNGNNTVDAGDLGTWKGDFGIDAGSDANGDGQTNGNDFLAWQASLGSTGTAANGWIEAGGSSASQIGELRLTDATVLAPGAEINLGAVYNNAIGDNNIVFNVSSGQSPALGLGSVVYVSGAATAVPEPASMVMSLGALSALACLRRRRTK
jgi:hypothetical protein